MSSYVGHKAFHRLGNAPAVPNPSGQPERPQERTDERYSLAPVKI
jgi:hypothetical protein